MAMTVAAGRGLSPRRAAFPRREFCVFHVMPWPNLPPPKQFLREHEAAWVTLPRRAPGESGFCVPGRALPCER
jgi:hypothetical protein